MFTRLHRGLSQRTRGGPGMLDPPVGHIIFAEHSSKSWAPARALVMARLCQRYPTACRRAEHQAEHYRFCAYSQKRLCYLCMLGTPSTHRESCPSRRHIPARWAYQAGNATQACLLSPALSQEQDTRLKEQSPKRIHALIHTEEPPESLLAKAQDVTAPQCHQSFLSSWESQNAIIVWGISSCYRNIQQDTAWQLVMSVALNQTFWTISVQWKIVGGRKKKNRIKIANVALKSILPISPFSLYTVLPPFSSVCPRLLH